MGKFVSFLTYDRFLRFWDEGKVNTLSMNFILDTGQLYTHGIFINSAVFGTAANGAVTLSIAGTTNTLALSNHTHSNYLENNADIDITGHKITSNSKDLITYSGGALYIGGSDYLTYVNSSSNLKVIRDSHTYDVLDTGNFSIEAKTSTGLLFNNVALFTYGSNSFQLDYVRRYNVASTFDSLKSTTSMGTNLVDSKLYGYMTFYTEGTANNPAWAQIRVNIPDRIVEFRTSATSNEWLRFAAGALELNALNVAGIVAAPNANTKNKVWKTDNAGNPAWRDEATLTDNTAVKLGTAGATNVANGTVVSAASSSGIIFEGGINSFKVGNGTNSITVSVDHGLSTKNITINGSTYALYTSASSLPTILAPTTLGTNGQILGTNGTTLEWKTLEKDALYTATLSEVDLTTSWSNVDNLSTRLIESGSYIVQITYASCIYTGTFSYVLGGTVDDEIILHCSGTIDSVGGTNRGRLYAKIGTSSETTYLKLAVSLSESNANLSIKYRKLI